MYVGDKKLVFGAVYTESVVQSKHPLTDADFYFLTTG